MKKYVFVIYAGIILFLSACNGSDAVREDTTSRSEGECLIKDQAFFESVAPNPVYYDELGFYYPHPSQYKNNQIILAGFDASLKKVQNAIPSDKLIVKETTTGKTELLFLGMQGGTINDYETHEIWVAANVTYAESGEKGLYILSLPISHYVGYMAGKVIFGFNKFAADFNIYDEEGTKHFSAAIENEIVIEFHAQMDSSECWISEEQNLYTVKDDNINRSSMKINWPRGKATNENGAGFSINPHDLTTDLLDLEISSLPNWHTYMSDSQMILSAPEIMD